MDPNKYGNWINQAEPNNALLNNQRGYSFPSLPKISIIIPAWNSDLRLFEETLKSVFIQTYTNWELCIGDANTDPSFGRLLTQYLKAAGGKIKAVKIPENGGIVGNTNHALDLATGDFITFLDHDDTLASFALFEIVKCINENPKVDFIYSDEDKISLDGNVRNAPHFKPKWSPDLLRSCNYISHLSVYKKELLTAIGGKLKEGFEGAQDHELALRATEQAREIKHIRGILYHWREAPGSTSLQLKGVKEYAYDSGVKAVQEHLDRIGIDGTVSKGVWPGSYRIKYNFKKEPLVSIIIPNRDQYKVLKNCIDSITNKTDYKNYEIIIIENNSTDSKVFEYYDKIQKKPNIKVINFNVEGEFNFAEINNFGANHAKGEYILFLNNDTQVKSNCWLTEMMGFAQREDVGVVGAKLYYPDGTIQHAGVMINMGGTAGHPYNKAPSDAGGYAGRLQVPQNMLAVTGACLLTKQSIFERLGKFDENLRLAFNDVEYCIRVHEDGFRIVWTPWAELIHHESLTRGYEDTDEKMRRFGTEARYMNSKWEHIFKSGDPYFY